MTFTSDELRRLERLHVGAWPARETASIAGWLWRHSGGGSQRANSVSTLDFDGTDVVAALDEAEVRYARKGAPARIHSFGQGRPAGLAEILAGRGYREGEATTTMAKRTTPGRAIDSVEVADDPGSEWLEVYLAAITENRRAVNAAILATVPKPRAFFACRLGGEVVSTALCVADGDCAVIECVATRVEARRQGAARAVLGALEAWAGRQGAAILGLQASEANEPAIALYASLGFAAVDRNRFWISGERKLHSRP